MTPAFRYATLTHGLRDDLVEGHRRAFERIARPGGWWTGAERVAIAAETRLARGCEFCQRRKGALSPFGVEGTHQTTGVLPEEAVEAVHRITTDTARLSREWVEELTSSSDFSVEQYVELIGVATQTISIDFVHIGLGAELEPLPVPQAGEPRRVPPPGAKMEQAWVPMIRPENLDEENRDLYGGRRTGNVLRALSLVPDEVRALLDLSAAHYLTPVQMMDFAGKYRAIDRSQIELIAGRVSALNECFY